MKIDKSQVKYFIEKFKRIFGEDGLEKAEKIDWVEGIGELNKKEKKEILKHI